MTRVLTPRIVVAGPGGDSGKTLLSIGLIRALRNRGVKVAGYKKGPDYIDSGWLGVASGIPGRNLDTFMMSPGAIGTSLAHAGDAGLILVEGNRGLFDGMDAVGTHSTASLAGAIGAPVLLVLDVTKVTRTVAAVVLGCRMMDPGLSISGVILNRVATSRQERLIRETIGQLTGIPVLGAIPRVDGDTLLPGRHLGLVTSDDHPSSREAVETAGRIVASSVDLDAVLKIARRDSLPVEFPDPEIVATGRGAGCVAVARDQAFCFYYPENLEALEFLGANLEYFSPVNGEGLPTGCDAVYLGGGFPELHAEDLASNTRFFRDLRYGVDHGMPVYAECGGLMVLSRKLWVDGKAFSMAGILDLEIEQTKRPHGHGYSRGCVKKDTPWYPKGTELCGHEFHYSRVISGSDVGKTVVELDRGRGVASGRDGVVKDRVWASYLHTGIWGAPGWVEGFFPGEVPRTKTVSAWRSNEERSNFG